MHAHMHAYMHTHVCLHAAHMYAYMRAPHPPHTHTDLEYGLPVQARDSVLNVTDTLPKSDVGREYYLQNMDKKVHCKPQFH